MYSDRGKEMIGYIPWYYRDSKIMQYILDTDGFEIDKLRSTLQDTLSQYYADETTWGLERWEKELAITPPEGASMELRRALIKAKLLRPAIMTPQQIQAIINQFVQGKTARVIEIPGSYAFRIDIPFGDLLWNVEMRKALEEAKPAHLGYAIRYTVFSGLDETVEMSEGFLAQTALLLQDHYPWPGRRFDGTWKLHGVAEFDGGWSLDGSHQLDHRIPVPPGIRLDSRVDVLGPLSIALSGFKEKVLAKRCLDGGWSLDGNHYLGNNPAPIDLGGMLTVRRYRRLDGKWSLDGGDKNLLDGSFFLDGGAQLDGGGIRLGIRQYVDRIDGELQLQHVKKVTPISERHPAFSETMNADEQALLRHKISFADYTAKQVPLDGEYYLDGSVSLNENMMPHEGRGELGIRQVRYFDGTWSLDGGPAIRLNGAWPLNGKNSLIGGGIRLEVKRRTERL